nr:reverse transcriptase domain-containing protein [Tanacetum cinerariifolium]
MATEGNGDLPVPDCRTMEELCQPSLNGRGGPIASIAIQATNSGLKNDMIQQVQNSCQFHGLPGDDANKHLDKFLHVTQSIKPPLATLKTFMLREPTKGANQGQNQPPAYQALVYQALVHQPLIPQPQFVTTNKFTNFMKANDGILKNMQTNMTSLTNSNLELQNMFSQFMKMNTASSSGSGTLLVSTPRPNQRPLIPYQSRLQDQKLRDKANDQREKFFQIFKDLNFNISFADALILMPKFGPTIKTSLTNKDKLSELTRTPLNEHCSAVLLKKLPEKLGDPSKFLISCNFPRRAECLALADLGASINLMPLSVWNKLSLSDLYPTCMTLDLADHSISHPVGVTEDVFVKVGTFHFSIDFVVVDFDVDPRVPLILGRSFFRTGKAFIDVFEGELTLCVGKEAITFNLDQSSRYSANYNDMTANQIDVIDMACEEYSQEVLGFSNVIASSNPTPYYDPIVSTTSLTLSPFGNSDFLLEEVDAFLTLEDDPTSLEVDQSYELKIHEAKSDKSSIDEPLEVELKYLPPHLEYVFLEGDDKLLVIIMKDLSVEEKTALITVLKSHKQAIAWKHSDIKGYFQIPIDLKDQEKTTFTCPYGMFAYRSMPFGLYNAPGTFQRFIQDFSKIARPMTRLLEKDTPFIFLKECVEAFQTLKIKLTEASILISPDWDMPFELMCDASDFAIGVLHISLFMEKACHLPIELEHKAYWALKHANFDLQTTGDHRKVQLNELNALRDQAYENSLMYKEKTKRLHGSKIKDRIFNIGDRVLLFNSRLKIFLGKLKSRWSGPFTIFYVFSYSTVELSQPDGPNFKVNGHRLKHYFGEDVPKMVVPDLQTFPKDH